MTINVAKDRPPGRGVIIHLETRADVIEFFAALVAANVNGRAAEVEQDLLDILSEE